MADISIIEFLVYGIITYSGMIFLISTAFKEVPSTKSGSISRAIFVIPSAITALVLAFSGESIKIQSITNTIRDLNTTSVWTEVVETEIILLNDVWVLVHFLIFIVIIIYVFTQLMNLITKAE